MVNYCVTSNPQSCPYGRTDCVACYWSHVDASNQWTGTDECWNSGCITSVPMPERTYTGHELDAPLGELGV